MPARFEAAVYSGMRYFLPLDERPLWSWAVLGNERGS